MPDARAALRAPWIVAAVAGVVFVVLLVVYFVPLANARDSANPGQLSADEQRAMDAAGTEITNVTTLSRAHFSRDYARALAGATGALKSDIKAKQTSYLKVLTTGKYDVTGKVTHEALEGRSSKGDGYVVLVTLSSFQSTTPNSPTQSNLEVTVVRSGNTFLANDVEPVGLS